MSAAAVDTAAAVPASPSHQADGPKFDGVLPSPKHGDGLLPTVPNFKPPVRHAVPDPHTMSGEELKQALKRQVEYYFSRENLATDRYLVSQMNADGYVAVKTICSFNMIKNLTTDPALVVQVMRESEHLSLDETGLMVKPNIKQTRSTIMLREVPPATQEEVKTIFDGVDCGPVDVRPDVMNTWYCSLNSDENAAKALDHIRNKTFKDAPVKARIKTETLFRSLGVVSAPVLPTPVSPVSPASPAEPPQAPFFNYGYSYYDYTYPYDPSQYYPEGDESSGFPNGAYYNQNYAYDAQGGRGGRGGGRGRGGRRGERQAAVGPGGEHANAQQQPQQQQQHQQQQQQPPRAARAKGGKQAAGGEGDNRADGRDNAAPAPARARKSSHGASGGKGMHLNPADFPQLPTPTGAPAGGKDKVRGYVKPFKKFSQAEIIEAIKALTEHPVVTLPELPGIVLTTPNDELEASKPFPKPVSAWATAAEIVKRAPEPAQQSPPAVKPPTPKGQQQQAQPHQQAHQQAQPQPQTAAAKGTATAPGSGAQAQAPKNGDKQAAAAASQQGSDAHPTPAASGRGGRGGGRGGRGGHATRGDRPAGRGGHGPAGGSAAASGAGGPHAEANKKKKQRKSNNAKQVSEFEDDAADGKAAVKPAAESKPEAAAAGSSSDSSAKSEAAPSETKASAEKSTTPAANASATPSSSSEPAGK